MRRTRMRTGCVVLLAAVLSTACYSYVPEGLESISVGEDVRVRVTDQAMRDFGDALTGEGPVLEGRVLEHDGESIVIHVPVGDRREGFYRESLRQRVALTAGDVEGLEHRRLERARTFTVVGVGALAAGGVVAGLLSGDSGGPTSDLPPGPSAAVLTLVRLLGVP